MPENKKKEPFLQKRFILKRVPLVLALASFYYYLRGTLVWSGILFLLVGVLSPFSGLPYAILFILVGLMVILLVYEKTVLLIIVGLFITVIALCDLVPLIRLIKSGKHRVMTSEEFSVWLKENEATYKLWEKLKRKYSKKS